MRFSSLEIVQYFVTLTKISIILPSHASFNHFALIPQFLFLFSDFSLLFHLFMKLFSILLKIEIKLIIVVMIFLCFSSLFLFFNLVFFFSFLNFSLLLTLLNLKILFDQLDLFSHVFKWLQTRHDSLSALEFIFYSHLFNLSHHFSLFILLPNLNFTLSFFYFCLMNNWILNNNLILRQLWFFNLQFWFRQNKLLHYEFIIIL